MRRTLTFIPSQHKKGPKPSQPHTCSPAQNQVAGMAEILPLLSSAIGASGLHDRSGQASACTLHESAVVCSDKKLRGPMYTSLKHATDPTCNLRHTCALMYLSKTRLPVLDNFCMLNQVLKLLLENLWHSVHQCIVCLRSSARSRGADTNWHCILYFVNLAHALSCALGQQ